MVYRLAKYIGAFATVLGALDAVVFTGGIGERSDIIRARVCAQLGVFGVRISAERNATGGSSSNNLISTEDSRVNIMVIETNEELMIAQDSAKAQPARISESKIPGVKR